MSGTNQLMELLAEQLQPLLRTKLDEQQVKDLVKSEIESAGVQKISVTSDRGTVEMNDITHTAFAAVMKLIKEGHQNIMLVGPSGTGKTMLASQVAKGLGLQFGFISFSAGVTETHLLGKTLIKGGDTSHSITQFVKCVRDGGIFLMDEIDAADANVMVTPNAFLANGLLACPDGNIYTRHKDCFIIAAANTFGLGADVQYVGRNQLDASTLDRFILATLVVDYDTKLEKKIVKAYDLNGDGELLLEWVWKVRKAIKQYRLRRVASTRLVVSGAMAIKAGATMDDVTARYFVNWTQDEMEKAKVQK